MDGVQWNRDALSEVKAGLTSEKGTGRPRRSRQDGDPLSRDWLDAEMVLGRLDCCRDEKVRLMQGCKDRDRSLKTEKETRRLRKEGMMLETSTNVDLLVRW